MLLLTQKKLQARIDQAIAQIPLPAPAKDWGPDLDALRSLMETMRAEVEDLRATVGHQAAALIPALNTLDRHTAALAVPPVPVDLAPLDERILHCELAVIQLGVKVVEAMSAAKQTDNLATYLLESPREIRTIREVGHTQTLDDPAAAPTLMVRPMGAL